MALYSKHFYHQIIRKYVIAFGTLFSNINVVRKSSNGTELHRENVPLTFASKEKFYQRLVQDYAEESRIAIKLPHIAFEITDYQYDTTRKINSKRTFGETDLQGNKKYFYNPVPYNIGFNLYVFSKTQEEGLQIIEQILPFFTPDYVLTLKLTELDSWKTDIPISLNSVNVEDSYEGDFETRRSIVWTLSFTLRGYLLGPIRSRGIITKAEISNTILENIQTEFKENVTNVVCLIENLVFESLEDSIPDIKTTIIESKNNVFISKVTGKTFEITVLDSENNLFDFTNYVVTAFYKKSLSSPQTQIVVDIISAGKINLTVEPNLLAEEGLYSYYVLAENNTTNDTIELLAANLYLK